MMILNINNKTFNNSKWQEKGEQPVILKRG